MIGSKHKVWKRQMWISYKNIQKYWKRKKKCCLITYTNGNNCQSPLFASKCIIGAARELKFWKAIQCLVLQVTRICCIHQARPIKSTWTEVSYASKKCHWIAPKSILSPHTHINTAKIRSCSHVLVSQSITHTFLFHISSFRSHKLQNKRK